MTQLVAGFLLGLSFFILGEVDSRAADAGDTFSPLVNGVTAVVSPGASGPLFPLATEWQTVVAGDGDTSPQPCTFVAARLFGNGRVVTFGHDGLFGSANFGLLDNGRFLSNTVAWLDSAGRRQVAYTSGHAEWVGGAALSSLSSVMTAGGYSFAGVSAPLTPAKLAGKSVRIVGNAWGAFTTNEIEVVRQFVSGGRGVCLMGLGWSWEPYHPGQTMEDYPMTRLAAPYGIWWLRQVISDPTDQFNGDPRFHVFYPQAITPSVGGAKETLAAAHATYRQSLPVVLETNEKVKKVTGSAFSGVSTQTLLTIVTWHSFLVAVAARFLPLT